MSGQFKIIDQDYNELGAETNDDSYVITKDNMTINYQSYMATMVGR